MGICRHSAARMDIWPDVSELGRSDAQAMSIDTPMRKQREPVTRLYDSACELLVAAQILGAATADRDATPAVAATVGCIDATLDALANAIGDMRRATVAAASRGDHPRQAPAVLERELGALEDALREARFVCDRTRDRTAPHLAQLTLG
jgi:hypothetical protein